MDPEIELHFGFSMERTEDGREVIGRDAPATRPEVAELTEQVVAAYRGLNERLGWVEDPAALDATIRASAAFCLGWSRRDHPDTWIAHGLWMIAEQLPDELAEELTEPWPLRALDHQPGRRTPPPPNVEIDGSVARITYGELALDPIPIPG